MHQPTSLDAAASLGLALDIADRSGRTNARWSASANCASRCRRSRSSPTLRRIPAEVSAALSSVDPQGARRPQPLPGPLAQPARRLDGRRCPSTSSCRAALTGVDARIVLAFGNRFPMITAHKVLAAYACLVPRLVTGRFDPTEHRADLAVDGQLRTRRCRHQSHHGLPRRGRAARGDEPRALRVARSLDRRPRRRHPHAGHRVERQRDLRQVRASCESTRAT